ncbi:MAG: thiamine pyrophosphate-dependent dehydrogenase E1 component subunit alpha [Burkholderiaceae bacterium]|nr:thiamine pyrophosphate-dependent dehydrogenase E1 component subunit alpha [Burkholderiaceae bacterium]
MCRIRAFEDAAEEASQGSVAAFGQALVAASPVRGPLHLSTGQEAVAAGVCAHLRPDDPITSTHRGHGHTLAKGADMTRMMLELFGKAGGFCAGKGGSMHIADFSVGMLGANGVVAAGMPIAVGAAHSLKIRAMPGVAVAFFGDGAINRGPFGESLNWAACFSLPLLFVCEDNQWSSTTRTDAMSAGAGPLERARSYGVDGESVDGMDIEAVWAAAGRLVAAIRAGGGPRMLHARTYRFKGHVSVDKAAYRDPSEVEAAVARDPLSLARSRMVAAGQPIDALEAIEQAARDEVRMALAAASDAPFPSPDAAYDEVQDTGRGQWT